MNAANGNDTQQKVFFDLHVTGLGYLNRARMVTPKKGPEYLACTITALRGEAGEKLYTKFDVRVVGDEALKAIEQLRPDANAKSENGGTRNKVLISFRLGDIMPETYPYTSGELKGQTGVIIKGRLLKVFWAKVNGENRYKFPEQAQTPAATGTEG